MDKIKRIPAFKEELCDRCGICLNKCPVLQLPLDEAKSEIQKLIEGDLDSRVLKDCTTCFSCNLYCPQKANPYQLILERWNDLYKIRGFAPIFKFVCPTESPNLWQLLNIFLSNKEKKRIYKWMKTKPESNDNLLFVDSFIHLYSFIIDESSLFEDFNLIDPVDYWCAGGYLYQLGILDVVGKIAKVMKNDIDTWSVKKIVTTLDAIHHMFNIVHPKEMGIVHDQEFSDLNEYFLEKINSGEITLPQAPLNITLTVHDNCFSKSNNANNGSYWETPRKILKKCGCKIIEMKHHKKDSLCCGWGAGASWTSNFSLMPDILVHGIRKFREAEETGADAIVTYCEGCNFVLWTLKELLGSKIDVYHIIEIIRLAMGEKLDHPTQNRKRALDINAILIYQVVVSIFQNNFYINRITYNREKNSFKPTTINTIALRAIRLLFRFRIVRNLLSKVIRSFASFKK
ncbi:MAG: (Fe-S)-binding protein [Promethearchaeota archaeon]|nr:MAG: (Fe-S)-binding protein [Candidatus Lokiarchaeota archaeon]